MKGLLAMTEKWAGITTLSNELTLVSMECENDNITVIDDQTFHLRAGPRPDAYRAIYDRVLNYLRENHIQYVVLKGSALNHLVKRASHLDAAELRGAVMVAAAQSGAEVRVTIKSAMSKRFGQRNVDAYVADNQFWDERFGNRLRKGSRETAMLILDARKQ